MGMSSQTALGTIVVVDGDGLGGRSQLRVRLSFPSTGDTALGRA